MQVAVHILYSFLIITGSGNALQTVALHTLIHIARGVHHIASIAISWWWWRRRRCTVDGRDDVIHALRHFIKYIL